MALVTDCGIISYFYFTEVVKRNMNTDIPWCAIYLYSIFFLIEVYTYAYKNDDLCGMLFYSSTSVKRKTSFESFFFIFSIALILYIKSMGMTMIRKNMVTCWAKYPRVNTTYINPLYVDRNNKAETDLSLV